MEHRRRKVLKCTGRLLNLLGKGYIHKDNLSPPDLGIIECARRNKVLLGILRKYPISFGLLNRLEARFRSITDSVEELSELMDGLNYAFFKLIKPIPYVPSDVDLLISKSDLEDAVSKLLKAGYHLVTRSRSTLTFRKDVTVDLYIDPSFGDLVYIDGASLLKFKCQEVFEEIRITHLCPEVEALVIATHALFKEWILTLNDVISFSEYCGYETYVMADEFRFRSLMLDMSELVRRSFSGEIELPYKVPLNKWIYYFLEKLRDPVTRGTIPSFIRRLLFAALRGEIIYKINRESY